MHFHPHSAISFAGAYRASVIFALSRLKYTVENDKCKNAEAWMGD
jgi:hypothetical protein